jgi:ABC-2 type transport system ATP-binding protein
MAHMVQTGTAAGGGGGERVVAVQGLTKRFGSVTAVDDLTFTVLPGRVTGFLGPNGAGKTTTMRMLLSLVSPTSGTATIGGLPYTALADPLRSVGASLEATGFHPGRSGRDHLRVLATTAGIDHSRADEVLGLVGLAEAARRRTGGYSMGMRQRLALAASLLGDPDVLLLDEPSNGLDPEGIAWLRGFLRHLAGEGRTILVSSHLLSEVRQTVDDVVIIRRGKLVRQGTLAELAGNALVLARTPTPADLARALGAAELHVSPGEDGAVRVTGATPAEVGSIAHRAGVELHELRAEESDLEQIFLELTREETAAGPPGGPPPGGPPVAPRQAGASVEGGQA